MTVNRPEPDYDTLLNLYGKAMLRISQLEAQLAHATDELRRHGNGRVLEATPELTEQGLQDLAVKVDGIPGGGALRTMRCCASSATRCRESAAWNPN